MSESSSRDTSEPSYTARLESLEGARWKRLLDVQAPYRWNLRRLLGHRRTLDVGCGIGRNLRHLPVGSLGVDHNAASVAECRRRGLDAVTPDELAPGARAPGPFDGLLAAHLVEHLSPDDAVAVLARYRGLLAPGARVVLICPQERGYASDGTHVQFVDHDGLRGLCAALDLDVVRQSSFPLPRAAGPWFTYNEFVTVAGA